jgi:anthranilate/para-aminobenzoate synthase component I
MRYNTAVHVGAGIVHDAVGPHEYRECLRKANAILNELYRLENQALQPT